MPGENETPNPNGEQPNAETPLPQPGGQSGEREPKPGRTYTDQEVNDLIAKEKRRIQESDELKALRAKAKRADDIDAASKSEVERLTERATKAEQLAAENADKFRQALIRSAFTTAAISAGVPADRIAHAIKVVDLDALAVDDAGTVTGVEAAVKSLPEWFAAPTANGQNGQPTPPNMNRGGRNDAPSRDQQVEQARREMRERGMSVRIT